MSEAIGAAEGQTSMDDDCPVQIVSDDDADSLGECSIEIEKATLSYPIGPFRKGSVKSTILNWFGRRETVPEASHVDALNSISLAIRHGERVGIIGRNGSGKSSLLRVIAGVYPLAGGHTRVAGRLGCLLDISLGFELESTGRENIYFRGLAMGYSRRDMREVEDEIVAFADLGQFIDLPMRTYSSGMFVRLGFAISTQFAPDILLVDEVFGAGDAVFAQRAVARMNQIVDHAGIVVIVSHELDSLTAICDRVIWLDKGSVKMDGPPELIISEFRAFADSLV